jgi:hypothetical protein
MRRSVMRKMKNEDNDVNEKKNDRKRENLMG